MRGCHEAGPAGSLAACEGSLTPDGLAATMKRHLLVALLLVAASALAGCATDPGPGTTETVETGFEDGLTLWTKNSDVPDDPNRPGKKVAWNITSSTERAHAGERSVNLTLDGSQDDGTIWITRPIGIEQGQRYRANVSVWAWSASESFNTIAHLVVSLGFKAPQAEEDFPPPGENSTGKANATSGGLRADLNQAEGWKRYSFQWTIPASEARELYAAVGISAVWETQMTYFVDDLTVELTRLASQGGSGQGGGSTY